MIKVAEWGTGMMGQGLLGYILDRPKDIDLCGVIVTNPAKEGKTVGELLGRPCDVKMTTDFEAVLAKKPDVVCINTQSNLDEVEPQVIPALKAGCNVICIAEKLSYPWASDPERADLFDRVAKENGVNHQFFVVVVQQRQRKRVLVKAVEQLADDVATLVAEEQTG